MIRLLPLLWLLGCAPTPVEIPLASPDLADEAGEGQQAITWGIILDTPVGLRPWRWLKALGGGLIIIGTPTGIRPGRYVPLGPGLGIRLGGGE